MLVTRTFSISTKYSQFLNQVQSKTRDYFFLFRVLICHWICYLESCRPNYLMQGFICSYYFTNILVAEFNVFNLDCVPSITQTMFRRNLQLDWNAITLLSTANNCKNLNGSLIQLIIQMRHYDYIHIFNYCSKILRPFFHFKFWLESITEALVRLGLSLFFFVWISNQLFFKSVVISQKRTKYFIYW